MVGVGELGEKVEVLLDVGRGVAERGEDEDLLFVDDGFHGRLDEVEVDVLDGRAVDLYGLMVVEEDGRLKMARPERLFIGAHLHGRLCWPEAVESVYCTFPSACCRLPLAPSVL